MKVWLKFLIVIVVLLLIPFAFAFDEECNLCVKHGFARKRGINEIFLKDNDDNDVVVENHTIGKRFVDPTFRGNQKTKADVWEQNFGATSFLFDQSISLIKLLNKVSIEYLNQCPPFVLYDTFVENSENYILQNLFQSFPLTFYHGKIGQDFRLENKWLIQDGDNTCRSYILFLSDPQMTRSIIGPQTTNKVIVVARSSQWKLRDFLSSDSSSNIINLLVIGESLTADPRRERPYVLYTHRLYADGLGSNVPVVLTSWVRGILSRPHINLFPQKFASGFSGHRFLIAAVNQPPFIFRTKVIDKSGTANVYWEGIEFRLIKLLSQKLNFSYEIIEPRNTALLGSGEAVREEVEQGRADIGMAGAYITYDRLTNIDMSIGHSRDCAAFITLASKALPKYRAIMGPFQWTVWIALIAVYFLGVFPLAYTDRLSLSHLLGNWGEIENMFWYVFGTFTNSLSFSGKFSWSNSQKLSTRLLIGFYWLFTIIITACYTGSIIAFVTLPAFPDTIDSVNDLLGLFFRVGTLDKGGWERWFVNSSHQSTAKLYKKMEFVNTIEEGVGNVTQSFFWNYAFLGSRSQLEYLVQANFTNEVISKRSALHLSEECFAPFQVAYTFPKNSVYAKRINDYIVRIQQNGIMQKLENEVSWKMQRSATGKLLQASSGHALRELIQEERQLTTADTEGMFLLMGAGYLLAALALTSEIIGGFTNKCRAIIKRRRRKSSTSSSFSSNPNSATVQTQEEIKKHLERKALRKKEHAANKPRSRFPGLDELNLTKATLKELYGGYNRREPTIIVQNGQVIFDTEAVSEESSLEPAEVYFRKLEEQENQNLDDEKLLHEAIIHYEGSQEEFHLDLEENSSCKKSITDDTTVESSLDKIDEHIIMDDESTQQQQQEDEQTVNLEKVDESFGESIVHSTEPTKKLFKF